MIAGLGRASLLVHNNVQDYYTSMKKTRNYMERQLKVGLQFEIFVHKELEIGSDLQSNSRKVHKLNVQVSWKKNIN